MKDVSYSRYKMMHKYRTAGERVQGTTCVLTYVSAKYAMQPPCIVPYPLIISIKELGHQRDERTWHTLDRYVYVGLTLVDCEFTH